MSRAWPRWWLSVAFVAVGLAASIGVSLLFDNVFFLFLPLIFPFLFRWRSPPPSERACQECGYVARGAEEVFCPRHGVPLAGPESR